METAMLAFAVIGAIGSIVQGVQQASAANVAATQAEQDRQVAKVKAIEDENLRRQNLIRIRSSQIAAGAGMGMDVGMSGSLDAIGEGDAAQAEHEIGLIRTGAVITDQRYKTAIASDQSASIGYLMGGLFGAANSLGSAGMQSYQTFGHLPLMGGATPAAGATNVLVP